MTEQRTDIDFSMEHDFARDREIMRLRVADMNVLRTITNYELNMGGVDRAAILRRNADVMVGAIIAEIESRRTRGISTVISWE